MGRPSRRATLLLLPLVAVALVAVPVLGQEPSASPSTSADPSFALEPTASAEPSASGTEPSASPTALATAAPAATPEPAASAKPDPSEKPDKGDREPEVPVSLTGRVGTVADADGDPEYTLTVGTTVYTLDAGPRWWWADEHPLAAYVGDTVSIVGEREGNGTSIDVFTAGGTTIRSAGRPPWAGGWKVVGEKHPGWSQAKADKWAQKQAKWAAKWPDGKPGNGPGSGEAPPAP